MPYWNTLIKKLNKTHDEYLCEQLKSGKTFRDLINDELLKSHGYYGIAHRIRFWKDNDEEIERLYLEHRDRTTQQIYKTIFLAVPENWVFGYLADTHLNSKYENLALLNKCYDEFAKRGIKTVFHAGDILDGWNVYKGQIYYVDRIGVSNQVKYCIDKYPARKGMVTYFIEGNHDNHIFRSSSMRIGEMIQEKRQDLQCLGVYRGDINIVRKQSSQETTLIRLFHAEGGSIESYSAVRRYIGRLGKADLPDYLLVGHYHCSDRPVIRGVKCIFGKTTQEITPYQVHKGFSASLGAWVITAKFDKNGKMVKTIEEEI